MTQVNRVEIRAGSGPSRRCITWTLVRAIGSVTVLVTLYYLLPLDAATMADTLIMLLVGLGAFVALVVHQIRSVLRARYPGLRAIEALAVSVPVFLLLFSATYIAMADLSPDSFGEHLSHTDGLYFVLSVFSTVGFGDITAKTQAARAVVTAQMVIDLIIFGLVIKVFAEAVHRGRQRRPGGYDTHSEDE